VLENFESQISKQGGSSNKFNTTKVVLLIPATKGLPRKKFRTLFDKQSMKKHPKQLVDCVF